MNFQFFFFHLIWFKFCTIWNCSMWGVFFCRSTESIDSCGHFHLQFKAIFSKSEQLESFEWLIIYLLKSESAWIAQFGYCLKINSIGSIRTTMLSIHVESFCHFCMIYRTVRLNDCRSWSWNKKAQHWNVAFKLCKIGILDLSTWINFHLIPFFHDFFLKKKYYSLNLTSKNALFHSSPPASS